ncbi:MAG TPA: ornithine cyclodeaminase family protein [Candidatus Acidoferrales bacterium]|jgi:ornithine cyclodeaminase/alanine dehydrogenase-like protein (mu-crystallin family)|nr:ornithine cyclodeaminase family protein [Candidatus Acidoferrales bacterium]
MVLYSEDQVRKAINIDDVIRVIGAAFVRGFATVHMPARTMLKMDDAILLVMPCYDTALHAAGVKLVSVSAKARVQAVYELLDPQTGIALARMEANYLTDVRTAATSAVATELLARKDVETLGIFGSGRLAVAHFAALPRVRNFKRFLVCGSGRTDVATFCGKMKNELGITVEPANAETLARESDVLCTCTPSPRPLFDGNWLRPGTHLNLVGAFQPETREVDDVTIKRSYVVVDAYGGALAEAGDLLIPIQNGTIERSHIVADLHEIASGKKPARTNAESITLFKSVGCALEDLVTAQLVYRNGTAK